MKTDREKIESIKDIMLMDVSPETKLLWIMLTIWTLKK